MDMSSTIIPKSDQLNADDLLAGARTVTITAVRASPASAEQPVAVSFEGDGGKPYMPCKSMRRVMVAVWGADASQYAGRSMTLFRDPEVTWGGMAVGGIRISHMSHLDAPMTLALTATKKARKPYRVLPLVVEQPSPKPVGRTLSQFLDALELELHDAATWEDVQAIEARADVQRARDVAKNGQADRLSDMLDAARERTMGAEPPAPESPA